MSLTNSDQKTDPNSRSISFDTLYTEKLQPALHLLDDRRREIARGQIRGITILIGVGVLVGLSIWIIGEPHPVAIGLAVVGGIIGLGTVIWASRNLGAFVHDFKEQVIRRIVKHVDPNLQYHPESGITEDQFRRSKIFQHSCDRYTSEDRITGKIGETDLTFSEVHAQYKTTTTNSKGQTQTHWHTIFKGLFFLADFSKHFQGETIILPDSLVNLGSLGRVLQGWNFTRPGQLVELEDPEFESHFVVYSTDQVEARYLLTPAMMERLVEVRRKFDQGVAISFVGGQVYLALTMNRDLFEPRIFKSLVDREATEVFLADLDLVLGLVQDLKLNTRIWTKV